MPGVRAPGPICVTTGSGIDSGTLSICRTPAPAPIGHGANKTIHHKQNRGRTQQHASAHVRKEHLAHQIRRHEKSLVHKLRRPKPKAPVAKQASNARAENTATMPGLDLRDQAPMKMPGLDLREDAAIPFPTVRRKKPAGEFDDDLVIDYIMYAMSYAPQWIREWNRAHPHPESEELKFVDMQFFGLQKRPPSVRVHFAAWQLLKVKVRGDEYHRYDWDYEASAAEHFMFIYYLAELTGDPYCYAGPIGYEVVKAYESLKGDSELQKERAQSDHPVLPANAHVALWGNVGVSLGLEAYKADSKGGVYNWGEAVESLAQQPLSPERAKKVGDYAKRTPY